MSQSKSSDPKAPVSAMGAKTGNLINPMPVFTDRMAYDEADNMLTILGQSAALHAADNADDARERGNHIRFCHWRQVERLIVMLSVQKSFGTIH